MKKIALRFFLLALFFHLISCSKKHSPVPNNQGNGTNGGNSSTTKPDTTITVTTLAGNGLQGSNDGAGFLASFNEPQGITIDPSGKLYVLCLTSPFIRKIDPAGNVTSLDVGNTISPSVTSGITCNYAGTLFVTDSFSDIIQQIDASSKVTIFVGDRHTASYDIDGTGLNAGLASPTLLTCDKNNTIDFVCYTFNTIRQATSTGVVTTLEGDGQSGTLPAIPEVKAKVYNVNAIAADSAGKVYAYSLDDRHLYVIDPKARTCVALAGNGTRGLVDGPTANSSFYAIRGLAVDSKGTVYAADDNEIRTISNGVVKTIAGAHTPGYLDGSGSSALFNDVQGITLDNKGNLYVLDAGNLRVRKITITIH